MTARLLDAALLLTAVAAHAAAAAALGVLPPDGVFDLLVGVLPLVVHLAAAGLLLVRNDRRGVPVACTLQWLLVLFGLPAFGRGLLFAPSAVLLSVVLARSGRAVSSGPAAAG